jgi:hypothetical protein
MGNLLRQALASEDYEASPNPAEQASIIMKGPLAEVYTKALAIAYSKDQPLEQEEKKEAQDVLPEPDEQVNAVVESLPAMESLQMDSVLMKNMAKLVNPANGDAQAPPASMVYTVSKRGVDEPTVIEVANELSAVPDDRRGDYILIIDATTPSANGQQSSAPEERMARLGATLESLVESFGGRVYHSLGEYLQAGK